MADVPLYRDEAVVLRTHPLGEADRIITLLTKERGRIRAVAKGVRRTKSRFGARLEPFMVVDVQCYEGRNLDTVTQAESLATYGQTIARDYTVYTAATVMVETAERLTEEHEPSTQQYLLLAGALRSLGGGEHDPGLVLDAYLLLARGRGLGTELPRLREVWGPRTALGLQHPCGRCGMPGVPPARVGGARAGDAAAAGRTAQRGLGPCRRLRPARPPRGQWTGDGVPPVAPRARGPLAAARRAHRPGLTGDAHQPVRGAVRASERCPTPVDPGRGPPEARGHRHGRQRPLGQRPRTAPDEGARGGRGLTARRRGRGDRGRRDPPVGVCLLDRELAALPGRGALPHGLQPRRDPTAPRPAKRVGCPDAVGRATPAAVAVGHPRARGRPGPHSRQHRPDPLLLRELRGPGRGRRRRGPHRRGRPPGPAETGRHRREDHRPLPRRARHARRRPVRAVLRRAADLELPALAVRLRRDGLPQHALAGLRPPQPLGSDRDLRQSRPPRRRCRRPRFNIS